MYLQKWTQHLTNPQDKERFEKEVLGAKNVLNRLASMVDERVNTVEHQELAAANYSCPNWAYLQADYTGVKRFARFVKDLINLDQKENTNDPTKPIRKTERPVPIR